MENQTNVKESAEFVYGAVKLGKFMAGQFSDGIQARDFLALGKKIVDDEAFRNAMMEAAMGIQNAPAELKEHHGAEDLAALGEAALRGLREAV